MSLPPMDGSGARGIVRLLNTAAGRTLCLAGDVDGPAVDSFRSRYGREPARIDRIDAASVTALGTAGVELLLDHLDAALGGDRPVEVSCSAVVGRLLADAAVQT